MPTNGSAHGNESAEPSRCPASDAYAAAGETSTSDGRMNEYERSRLTKRLCELLFTAGFERFESRPPHRPPVAHREVGPVVGDLAAFRLVRARAAVCRARLPEPFVESHVDPGHRRRFYVEPARSAFLHCGQKRRHVAHLAFDHEDDRV